MTKGQRRTINWVVIKLNKLDIYSPCSHVGIIFKSYIQVYILLIRYLNELSLILLPR